MFALTGVNHCIERIDTKVAFGFVRWNVSVSPLAVMPEIFEAFPSRNAWPPMMSSCSDRLTPSGEPIFGLRIRSHDRWNDAAVTAEPFENFRPGRMWNVYVFPSFETVGKAVAACGVSCAPA